MKRITIGGITLLSIGLGYFTLRKADRQSDHPLDNLTTEKVSSFEISDSGSAKVKKTKLIPQSKEESKATSPVEGVFSSSEFDVLFTRTEINSASSLFEASNRLLASDPKDVSNYFSKTLSYYGVADHQRYRLVVLANSLGTADLLPFWTEVMDQRLGFHQGEIPNVEHSIESQQAYQELTLAIKNIASAAITQPAASLILKKFVLDIKSSGLGESLRLESYWTLKNSDPFTAAQILMGLSDTDSLKALILDQENLGAHYE